jgi:excisionase family DNA binding protein
MDTITLEQAAEFLHMHVVTLRNKARLGEIPAAKVGKVCRDAGK